MTGRGNLLADVIPSEVQPVVGCDDEGSAVGFRRASKGRHSEESAAADDEESFTLRRRMTV